MATINHNLLTNSTKQTGTTIYSLFSLLNLTYLYANANLPMLIFSFIYYYREQANTIHHDVVDSFIKWADKLNINCTVKKESEISETDMTDSDLCISIGKKY